MAVTWAGLSAAIGYFALLVYFSAEAGARFDRQLTTRHLQLVVALGNSGDSLEGIEMLISDPDYERPFSGRYWQITGPDGQIATSRSLFDSVLPVPGEAGPEAAFWTADAPVGALKGAQQAVTLENGTVWVVSVAEAMDKLTDERRRIGQSLLGVFAFVAALSATGAVLLMSTALRPLTKLREEVVHRWDAGEALEPESYPEEVAPLVADINQLLVRNRAVLETARRQAADLAHALKTPSAILRNEIERLTARRKGGAGAAGEALDRIDAQITRSMARARAGSGSAESYRTDLSASVERLARLFRIAPGAEGMALVLEVAPGLTVPVDRQDIEEVLGNLLENALKWRRKSVRLAAWLDHEDVVIEVDDDGPGIPEARRTEALRSGVRLDMSAPGSGLGLAIAGDLVAAYDGTMTLGEAPELGGLRVTVRLPAHRTPLSAGPVSEG